MEHEERLAIYRKAFTDGLRAFAFWKDGVEYCGISTMMPLSRAIANPEALYAWDPPQRSDIDHLIGKPHKPEGGS